MQSRIVSLFEALVNVTVGYVVAVWTQILVFPMFGIHVPLRANMWIGMWFTIVSVIRSYCLRRCFNLHAKNKPTKP